MGARILHSPLGRSLCQPGDTRRFLRDWAAAPLRVGAVMPSGRALSAAMAAEVDPGQPGPVVEIGPGTGPVTAALLERGIDPRRLVLVEFSPEFCALLRARFPGVAVVQGDAYRLDETLGGLLDDPAAAIVSSLPLLARPEAERLDLMARAFGLMAPGAPFVQFTYSVASPVPLREASQRLGLDWTVSPRVWRNVPPARVWTYRRAGS